VSVLMEAVATSACVADGLHFPTSLAFDGEGRAYVAESGLPFAGAPAGGRVLRLREDGSTELVADGLRAPVNGLVWHDGGFYVSEGGFPGRISRLTTDGERTTVVDGLPGRGNYHVNTVAVGPDGMLYWGQGAMTNLGIVGLDAYDLAWLKQLPHPHDVPGMDVVLTGFNAETADPLEGPEARALTRAV
jgi:glucose/arabinose dehydrogenase